MVEVKIKQPKQKLEDLGFTNINFDLDTSIVIDEDATITEFMLAIVKAMQIEGYKVTQKAMQEAIEQLINDGEIETETL